MKKLLALFIIGIMVFGTGAVSFASEAGDNNMNQKNKSFTVVNGERVKADAKDMMHKDTTPAAIKAHFTEQEKTSLSALTLTIKENQKILVALKKDILKNLQILKQTLKTSDAAITVDTMNSMKDVYEKLGIERKEINVNMHPGVIKNQMNLMKEARGHKNFTATEAYLKKVIEVQGKRYATLTDLNEKILLYIKNLD